MNDIPNKEMAEAHQSIDAQVVPPVKVTGEAVETDVEVAGQVQDAEYSEGLLA